MEDNPLVIVAARNEADRIGATLDALAATFPRAELWVADDASEDRTSAVALGHGARVVSRGRPHGKGANVTAAAEAALGAEAGSSPRRGEEAEPSARRGEAAPGRRELILLCDGDLGASAGALRELVEAVERGECDLAVAAFRRRLGGGFGVALRFARWVIRSRCGYVAGAPISGQRAMRVAVLRAALPLATGYGMEVAMTVDAVRAGFRVREIELDLEHRATGRTLAGFLHRSRQLRDFARAWWARRRVPGPSMTR